MIPSQFQLSIVRNQLLRMYGVSKLHNLVTLNLANNGILTIEGIKDLTNLQTLCLAGNNIKVGYGMVQGFALVSLSLVV